VVVNNTNVTFKVTGKNYGSGVAMVKVTNGDWVVSSSFNVNVVDPNWISFFALATDKKALAIKASDGSVFKDHSDEMAKVVDGVVDGEYIDYAYSNNPEAVIFTTQFTFDKKYNLGQLELWFKSGAYATHPNKIKLLTSEDGTTWNIKEEMTPSGLYVKWELSQIVMSSMFKIEMHYNDGYNDECELFEVVGTGGVATATAIGDIDAQKLEVAINPNPLTVDSKVSVYMPVAGEVSIDIFSITGNKVAQLKPGVLGEGMQSFTMEANVVEGLSAGVYVVVINTPSGNKALKVIKR